MSRAHNLNKNKSEYGTKRVVVEENNDSEQDRSIRCAMTGSPAKLVVITGVYIKKKKHSLRSSNHHHSFPLSSTHVSSYPCLSLKPTKERNILRYP